jgi:hypothetical protein
MRDWSMASGWPKTTVYNDSSLGEIHSWWSNKYKKSRVRRMEKFFDGFEVRYVPRLDKHDADHLA